MHSVVTGHCFDDITELLTPDGWVNGLDIKPNDTVSTYNLQTETTEWQPVQEKFIYNNYDKLINIKSAALSLQVTEDHGMVCYDTNNNRLQLPKAKELLNKYSFILPCAAEMKREAYPVSDNQIKLVTWVVTDGSYSWNQVRFHFKKQRKIDALKQLLNEMSIEYTCNDKIGKLAFQKDHLKGLVDLDTKILPDWIRLLNKEQAITLLETYSITDGNKNKDAKNSYQISSFKDKELEILQEVFCLAGFRTCKGKHHLTINTRSRIKLRKNNVSVVPYKGNVWCVSVPNGTLLVRHGGHTAITQNTHRMAYIVESDGVGNPILSATFGWLGDVSKIDYVHRITAVKNYVLGFGIGYVDPTTGVLYATPIPIIRNKCVLNGKIYQN
jgi:hypothetical protein